MRALLHSRIVFNLALCFLKTLIKCILKLAAAAPLSFVINFTNLFSKQNFARAVLR